MADLERSDPNYDAENTRVAPNLHKNLQIYIELCKEFLNAQTLETFKGM